MSTKCYLIIKEIKSVFGVTQELELAGVVDTKTEARDLCQSEDLYFVELPKLKEEE